jgi:hypothetical protein
MIRDGYAFLEFLHKIRHEDSEKLKGLSDEEYAAVIEKKAKTILDEPGYAVQPAPAGLGNLILKDKES